MEPLFADRALAARIEASVARDLERYADACRRLEPALPVECGRLAGGLALFAPHVTWIGFRRGRLLRGYMYEFLKDFAPHLTRRLVDQAIRAGSGAELDRLFEGVDLPTL